MSLEPTLPPLEAVHDEGEQDTMTVYYWSSDEEASASEPELPPDTRRDSADDDVIVVSTSSSDEDSGAPPKPRRARKRSRSSARHGATQERQERQERHVRMAEHVTTIGSNRATALRGDTTRLRMRPGRLAAISLDSAIASSAEEQPRPTARQDQFADYPFVPSPSNVRGGHDQAGDAGEEGALFAGMNVLLTGLKRYSPRTTAPGKVVGEVATRGATLVTPEQDLDARRRPQAGTAAEGLPAAPPTVLLSDRPHRTYTYLYALAQQIPCVHYNWALHSIREGRLLCWRAYEMPAALGTDADDADGSSKARYPSWFTVHHGHTEARPTQDIATDDDNEKQRQKQRRWRPRRKGPRERGAMGPVAAHKYLCCVALPTGTHQPRVPCLFGTTLALCPHGSSAFECGRWEALCRLLGATVMPRCCAPAHASRDEEPSGAAAATTASVDALVVLRQGELPPPTATGHTVSARFVVPVEWLIRTIVNERPQDVARFALDS